MVEPDHVRNEKAKLSAAYFNNVAVALVVVGGFTPLAASVQSNAAPSLALAAISAVCIGGSAGLHVLGRRFLRSLVP